MDPHPNLAYTTVTTPPSPALSGGSLIVAAGTGARFGWTGSAFNATVWPAGERPIPSNAEIIRITNIAADTFSITRAQEGTVARAIVAGDQIAATLTQKSLTDIEAQLGGGGNVTSTGPLATPPGAPASGDLYLPNNAGFLQRYSGAAWIPWGPLFPLTLPIDGDFAWINQGGASISTATGAILLTAPTNAGVGWRLRVKAAPATPYTITACFLASPLNMDFHQWGLFFRQSSNGRLHGFTIQTNGETLQPFSNSVKYSAPTTFDSMYNQRRFRPGNLVWLRIEDTGVNRVCWFSADGLNWSGHSSIGRTDFLTADQVGFGANPENATYELLVTLLSWRQG